MLFFQAYPQIWLMSLCSFGFFVAVAWAVWVFSVPQWNIELPSKPFFLFNLIVGTLFMGVLSTLIDKPHLDASEETIEWLFMFSAFLGLPAATPLLVWATWGLYAHLRGEGVSLGDAALTGLGGFAVGCASSNMHDLFWCGIITRGYSQHFTAGYDLDLFVAFGQRFGIAAEVLADYATLGPYAFVLILGELLVAAACGWRLLQSR